MVKSSLLSAGDLTIVRQLLQWFRKTNRDLPWRRTYNPYHVWISEIMLQQTQMERGVTYFLRWINRFATAQAVAEAEEQEILKYWEGLGYYARARNLHKAAKVISNDFDGVVPCDYKQLLSLPGIGPYTAAAIASVAGNYDVAVIDANVTRVYARLFNIAEPVKGSYGQKLIAQIAKDLLPSGKARAYNQALMDFGGLVCTPRNPHCEECPVAEFCRALKAETVSERPVVGVKKKNITIHKVAGLICWNEKIFIQQRKDNDVWGGLWEFPGGEVVEGEPGDSIVRTILADCGLAVTLLQPITTVLHQYTHHKIVLHCFLCRLEGTKPEPVLYSACNYQWVSAEELEHFAFPAGPRKLLEHIRAKCSDLLSFSRRI